MFKQYFPLLRLIFLGVTRPKAAAIGFIGSADGSASIYLARKNRYKRDHGVMTFDLNPRALLRAAGLSAVLVLGLAGLAAILFSLPDRRERRL